MAKSKTTFYCQFCGHSSPKWLGKCPGCNAWDSLVEEKIEKTKREGWSGGIQPLSSVVSIERARHSTGIGEFDRVLGGGIVPGSVALIGGDPGIGKSTLVLHAMSGLASLGEALYVSGEESPEQIKLRADRLHITSDRITLLPETLLSTILATAEERKPKLLVVDSIQTIFSDELSSAPGSVAQVRECATRLMLFAKRTAIPTFIIGHVTKEGDIAGPRVLEHIVDTVLYFEGGKGTSYRILRAVKNRFGSTNEIGVFEMHDQGLKEVSNPSEIFLTENAEGMAGSIVTVSMEGTRPLLIELQALVSPSNFGIPRRTTLGVDFNRVNLMVAILDKRFGMRIGGMDIFVNVVAGLKLDEPSVDLAVIAALVSSFRNAVIQSGTFVFSEVGLAGELRAVSQCESRLKEAERLGFKRGVISSGNMERVKNCQMELYGAKHIEEAIEFIFR